MKKKEEEILSIWEFEKTEERLRKTGELILKHTDASFLCVFFPVKTKNGYCFIPSEFVEKSKLCEAGFQWKNTYITDVDIATEFMENMKKGSTFKKTAFISKNAAVSVNNSFHHEAYVIPSENFCAAMLICFSESKTIETDNKLEILLRIFAEILSKSTEQKKLLIKEYFLSRFRKYLSHDFRAVPAVIFELASLCDFNNSHEEIAEISSRIKRNTSSFKEAVNKMLFLFSKSVSGASYEEIELNDFLTDILQNRLSVLFSGKKTSFHMDRLPSVLFDRACLERVFSEIITDSLEHEADNVFMGFNFQENMLFVKDDGKDRFRYKGRGKFSGKHHKRKKSPMISGEIMNLCNGDVIYSKDKKGKTSAKVIFPCGHVSSGCT